MSLVPQLYPAPCDPMDYSPPGSSVHGILHTRILVGCHWGIFPTQRSNSGLLHCRHILYILSHQGSPLPTCFTSKCTKISLSLVPVPLLLFRILNSQVLLNGLSSRFSEPSLSPNCLLTCAFKSLLPLSPLSAPSRWVGNRMCQSLSKLHDHPPVSSLSGTLCSFRSFLPSLSIFKSRFKHHLAMKVFPATLVMDQRPPLSFCNTLYMPLLYAGTYNWPHRPVVFYHLICCIEMREERNS